VRTLIATIWHDARYAVRGYLRTPLFTIVAVATLVLGIGSTTAIFSVIDAVILRPLPYPRAAELVAIEQTRADSGAHLSVSPPNYFDLKEASRAFSNMAAYGTSRVDISGAGGEPEKLLAATSSYELFTLLGVQPSVGRVFTADDMVIGAPRVAVIAHGLWQRRFAGDPAIVGREMLLDGAPAIIVGVMPRPFEFPARGTDLWLPLRLSRTEPPNPGIPAAAYRQYRILSVVGRLRPGVSFGAARSEIMRLGQVLARQYPDANREQMFSVTRLLDHVAGPSRPALFVLFAAVACLLLIACANASSLVLLRAAARSRELAIRRAIGAGRARLIGQMVVESLVLALAGGAGGIVLAMWAVDVFVRLAPAGIPRLEDAHVDPAAAAFAFTVAIAAGVLFGIVPAVQVQRGLEGDPLSRTSRGTVSAANRQTRHLLVVIEVALSTVLLTGASLFIQSFVRLTRVDPGFRPAAVFAVDRIELPRRFGASRNAAFFEELLTRLRATPGIEAASATIGVPLDPRARFFVDDSTFSIARRPALPVGQRPTAALHVVAGEYFSAAGIPLKRGRSFDARDRADAAAVVIINETMARRYWLNEDPVGQTLTHDLTILPAQASTRQIVGIVGDVRHFGLAESPEPQMFIPHAQMPWPSMALLLRTSLPAGPLNAAVRDAVHALDAVISVPPARPMNQVISDAVGDPRFRAWLIGLFAAAAMVLAMVGLYGTVAFTIHQRTRELGLRMALGASPNQTMRLVLRSGVMLAGIGTGLGLIGACSATRVLTSMLFGVGPTDSKTFVIAAAAVMAVTTAACYLPARRIRAIEPLRALSDDANQAKPRTPSCQPGVVTNADNDVPGTSDGLRNRRHAEMCVASLCALACSSETFWPPPAGSDCALPPPL